MARSITNILAGLKSSLVTFAQAVNITINPNNWSKTDYKSLILNVVSSAVGIQEQQFDQLKVDVKDVLKTLPPSTYNFIQYMMINVFEYDATAVPIVQLDLSTNFSLKYPNPNPNFNIIKYCSPVPTGLGTTIVKIAGVGPSKISGSALSAAQTFANLMTIKGINYVVSSKDADRLFLQLDVEYNGLYSSVIQNNVINAITNFLLTLSTTNFDGIIKLSDLLVTIRETEGVTDVTFVNIKARPYATSFSGATDMVLDKTEVLSKWQSDAGYCILEDTSGKTLTDFRIGSSGLKNLNLIAV